MVENEMMGIEKQQKKLGDDEDIRKGSDPGGAAFIYSRNCCQCMDKGQVWPGKPTAWLVPLSQPCKTSENYVMTLQGAFSHH